jgi:hypothetical protein
MLNDIKKWAKEKCEQYKKDILIYITDGISKDTAIKIVLSDSCIGSGYKAQIIHELKSI